MREVELLNWDRLKTYEWFKGFSDSTYGMNVRMDVTNLVRYIKDVKESFFIDFLYIVLKSLNSIDEMRMRLVDDKPVIFDDINPAFTVMTKTGVFENVRHINHSDFIEFYKISSGNIEKAKKQTKIKKDNYNPEHCFNEYYITCVPWVDFIEFNHPIPNDKSSQCIPRVCWGKYVENDGKYELTLNITVSHIFVDGFHLSKAFSRIQEYLNKPEEILR